MKKRFLGALLALAVVGSVSAFATGIGVQGGYNVANGGTGAALTFKLDSFDGVFAVDANFANGQFVSAGLTVDYWVQNPRLAGMFHYYWGPGFAVAYWTNPAIYVAFRAVAGVNIFPVDFLELYAQIAWQPGFYIDFNNGFIGTDWWKSFPVNVGLRFWF